MIGGKCRQILSELIMDSNQIAACQIIGGDITRRKCCLGGVELVIADRMEEAKQVKFAPYHRTRHMYGIVLVG